MNGRVKRYPSSIIQVMPIYFRNKHATEYKHKICKQFEKLCSYFDVDPGSISIEILSEKEFNRVYELERKKKPEWFVVGSALNNGRVIVLAKKDFGKKKHHKSEFEPVILHELCHMFVRRITWPKHASIWIQEGICEYLSFGKKGFKVGKFIDFKEIETAKGWDKHHPYPQAGAFFCYLAKKYSDKKIVEFIKRLKHENNEMAAFGKSFGNFTEVQESFRRSLRFSG